MEMLDVVDTFGEPTGERVERETAHREGIPHRTSHVWIYRVRDGRAQILLQKRAANKDSFPGCYDISSAGHIPAGDGFEVSAIRELKEELGLTAKAEELVFCGVERMEWDDTFHGIPYHDRQISKVFLLRRDGLELKDLVLQRSEVEGARWMDFDALIHAVRHNTLQHCMEMSELKKLAAGDALLTAHERCRWANPMNPLYIEYHDHEWGRPLHDDRALFELLVLECFQSGLSWECILNKRASFRAAFDDFDVKKVAAYDEEKIAALMLDKGIVRNRRKLEVAVNNARVFLKLQDAFGSFDAYLWHFTSGKTEVYREMTPRASSPLSDKISADLKAWGMCFVGTVVVHAFLQAAGVLDEHEPGCFCCERVRTEKSQK